MQSKSHDPPGNRNSQSSMVQNRNPGNVARTIRVVGSKDCMGTTGKTGGNEGRQANLELMEQNLETVKAA